MLVDGVRDIGLDLLRFSTPADPELPEGDAEGRLGAGHQLTEAVP